MIEGGTKGKNERMPLNTHLSSNPHGPARIVCPELRSVGSTQQQNCWDNNDWFTGCFCPHGQKDRWFRKWVRGVRSSDVLMHLILCTLQFIKDRILGKPIGPKPGSYRAGGSTWVLSTSVTGRKIGETCRLPRHSGCPASPAVCGFGQCGWLNPIQI